MRQPTASREHGELGRLASEVPALSRAKRPLRSGTSRASTPAGDALYFVLRATSRPEGLLGKRVRRLAGRSLLAFFAEAIERAKEPRTFSPWLDETLEGRVPGLELMFLAMAEARQSAPRSAAALSRAVKKHLSYEPAKVESSEGSLRILLTDEVQDAVFFVESRIVEERPERFAWLLHTRSTLPEVPEGSGESAPTWTSEESTEPERATVACLFGYEDRESLPGRTFVVRGARLPDFREALIARADAAWPLELRVLRAQLGADGTLETALARCADRPLARIRNEAVASRLGLGSIEAAHAEAQTVFGDEGPSGHAHVDRHAALVATAETYGRHQHWVLFDDHWAAHHPELAASLIHTASHWDPLAKTKSPEERRALEAAYRAAGEKRLGESLAYVDEHLAKNPSPGWHRWRASILRKLGRDAEADAHEALGAGSDD